MVHEVLAKSANEICSPRCKTGLNTIHPLSILACDVAPVDTLPPAASDYLTSYPRRCDDSTGCASLEPCTSLEPCADCISKVWDELPDLVWMNGHSPAGFVPWLGRQSGEDDDDGFIGLYNLPFARRGQRLEMRFCRRSMMYGGEGGDRARFSNTTAHSIAHKAHLMKKCERAGRNKGGHVIVHAVVVKACENPDVLFILGQVLRCLNCPLLLLLNLAPNRRYDCSKKCTRITQDQNMGAASAVRCTV